jgi:uncharacterized protein (UPF0305 family)
MQRNEHKRSLYNFIGKNHRFVNRYWHEIKRKKVTEIQQQDNNSESQKSMFRFKRAAQATNREEKKVNNQQIANNYKPFNQKSVSPLIFGHL